MRHKPKPDEPTEVDLPRIITPMLDMSFQLLAFFIIMFHPSALEGQMALNLPAAGEAKAKDASQVDPTAASDADIELPAELTVVVETDRGGANDSIPSHYLVKGLQTSSAPMQTVQELQAYLVKAKAGLNNKEDIKLQADGKLKWAYVVEVMDACRKPEKDGGPGFLRVSFAPPPDLDSPEKK